MSALRFPNKGPILGHATASTMRVWIRGGDEDEKGAKLASNRRTIGVIAICKEGNTDIQNPEVYFFRLHREFDRTGTHNLGEEVGIVRDWDPATRSSKSKKLVTLKPGTTYTAVVGTLTIDDPHADDESVSDEDIANRLPEANNLWPDLKKLIERDLDRCTAEFTTFPDTGSAPAGELSFILGSCRYPGLLWKVKEADRIFGPLLKEALGKAEDERRRAVEFTLMVGDQIYADMLNRHVPIGLADSFEEFQERYLTAFGSPNMKNLLRQVPTYMILDDHEISDNWSQDRLKDAEARRIFNLAIGAYMSYQWSHGPRNYGRRLYYNFTCAGYPFFVLDTRTQRFMDDVDRCLADNHLLGRPTMEGEDPNQLDRLFRWLKDQQEKIDDAPKFVVSSSVFAPNPMRARTGRDGDPRLDEDRENMVEWLQASDSWPAFPNTRRRILRHIIDEKIQNVVFLSGDIHCSNVAEISFSGSAAASGLRAFSVTSSAFYWPFFFADGDPSNYVHDSKASDQRDTFLITNRLRMDYEARNFTQDDNFCRLDIDRASHSITVRPFDTEGKIISKRDWLGNPTEKLVTKLELARW